MGARQSRKLFFKHSQMWPRGEVKKILLSRNQSSSSLSSDEEMPEPKHSFTAETAFPHETYT